MLSGPRALADCQVYLAILGTLSCPFYVPLGMSAAITLQSNPWVDGARGEPGANRWESVHDRGQLPNTHLCCDEKAGPQPEVNGAPTWLACCQSKLILETDRRNPHLMEKTTELQMQLNEDTFILYI